MMREPKVLLVYPPSQLMDLETPRPDGSLGLLYLAGALRQHSFAVDILDAVVGTAQDQLEDTFYNYVRQPHGLIRIGVTNERLKEIVINGGYNIVGIHSNLTSQTRMALEVARCIKEANPEMLIMVGGVNARNMLTTFFRDGWIDLVCLTEGEKIFVELVKRWSRKEPWNDIAGTAVYKDASYYINPVNSNVFSSCLDDLPMPAWDLLPFEKYEQIVAPHGDVSSMCQYSRSYRYAPIMTSRGCPFRCTFCHISTEKSPETLSGGIGTLRLKSIDRVLIEMEQLKTLGVSKLYFEDDSLLAKKDRVKTIFEKAATLGFSVTNVNGVNLVHFLRKTSKQQFEIDRDYLELLKIAGFDLIVFPVESASQRILDQYATSKWNHSNLDLEKLVRLATDIGITCPINMMIGFPDETEKEIFQSIELGRRLVDAGAQYCSFFIPIPFPGSQLFELALKRGYLESSFDPDQMNWHRPVMKNTMVPPERLLELREWAWRQVNRKEYVEARISQKIGSRWSREPVKS